MVRPERARAGRSQARASEAAGALPGSGLRSQLPASQAVKAARGRLENTLKIRTLQSRSENRLAGNCTEITQQSQSMLRGLSRVLPGLQTRQHISVHVKRDSHTRPSAAAVSPTPGCRLRVACVCGTLEASPPARCSAWGQGTLSVGTLSTRVPGVGTPSPLGLHREGGKQFSQKCRQQWRLRKQDRLPLGQPQTAKTK